MTKTIAERLQTIKEESGAIYADIAREVGVHATTVASYVKGKTVPNSEMIQKLAKFFSVKPEEIDESLKDRLDTAKRMVRYSDPSQPSVKKTQAGYIALALQGFKQDKGFTVSEFYEKLGRKFSISTLTAILNGRHVPSQEIFDEIQKAYGFGREEFDPFYVNGSEIDFGKVIHHKAMALIAESNVSPNDVDREMGLRVGKFYSSFIEKYPNTGKHRIPSYRYIEDVAKCFDVDPSEIDPFTNSAIVDLFKKVN